jgi:hypothetical protein
MVIPEERSFWGVPIKLCRYIVRAEGGGVAGVEPPQRGAGRNEVRPRGETSPLCAE